MWNQRDGLGKSEGDIKEVPVRRRADGRSVVQDRRLAALFRRYGAKATFNLNSALLGKEDMGGYPGKPDLDISKLPVEELETVYAGHEIAGAISFLHNVLRELIGIILIPILARRVGYIEINVLPGIACMDVAMPIVRQATRDGIIAYAFIIGFFEELTATFLLPGIIGV